MKKFWKNVSEILMKLWNITFMKLLVEVCEILKNQFLSELMVCRRKFSRNFNQIRDNFGEIFLAGWILTPNTLPISTPLFRNVCADWKVSTKLT